MNAPTIATVVSFTAGPGCRGTTGERRGRTARAGHHRRVVGRTRADVRARRLHRHRCSWAQEPPVDEQHSHAEGDPQQERGKKAVHEKRILPTMAPQVRPRPRTTAFASSVDTPSTWTRVGVGVVSCAAAGDALRASPPPTSDSARIDRRSHTARRQRRGSVRHRRPGQARPRRTPEDTPCPSGVTRSACSAPRPANRS